VKSLLALCFVVAAVGDTAAAPSSSSTPSTQPSTQPSVTKAQRAGYRKHLAAGRKLGAAKRWGEAVVEFEAALRAMPMDARALTELGLAAYAAGDYKKARKADADAVRVAADPKVRAAGYYNLGLVDEAERDRAGAAEAYLASLALRPGNATVTKALARLGQKPPAPGVPDAPICGTPGDVAAICRCLMDDAGAADPDVVAAADDPEGSPFACAVFDGKDAGDDVSVAAALPAGHQIVELDDRDSRERTLYLLARTGKTWTLIADLGTAYNPGMAGVSEQLSIDTVAVRSAGAHKLLWIATTHLHNDTDAGIDEIESTTTKTVTLCPISDRARCTLEVPVDVTYDRDTLGVHDDDDTIEHTKGLPIRRHVHLDLSLGADGVATVTLRKGAAPDEPGLLGPHPLF